MALEYWIIVLQIASFFSFWSLAKGLDRLLHEVGRLREQVAQLARDRP